MPKFSCRCGYTMVLRTMEEDFLYDLISQKTVSDIFFDKVMSDDNKHNLYMESRIDTMVCPNCKRMWVQDKTIEKDGYHPYFSYLKEDGPIW